MKREAWDDIAARLVFPGASAKLQCDGYAITLEVQRDRMKMLIVAFVDGRWLGKWLLDDCEERRRFMRPVRRVPKPYTAQQQKLLGKKWCAEQREKRSGTYYLPYWASVASIRRHFEKANGSVELFTEEAA